MSPARQLVPKPRAAPFDVASARARAALFLSQPPKLDWIVRPTTHGEHVARFVLPIQRLPTTNATRGGNWRVYAGHKEVLWRMMFVQNGGCARSVLGGRPQVHCVRFSATECDPCADWAKFAVDLLCVPHGRQKNGLCIIAGDRGSQIELSQRWEPCKRADSLAVIDVWTGEKGIA